MPVRYVVADELVAEQPPAVTVIGLRTLRLGHAGVGEADALTGHRGEGGGDALVGCVDHELDDPAVDVGARAGGLDPGVHQQLVRPILQGPELPPRRRHLDRDHADVRELGLSSAWRAAASPVNATVIQPKWSRSTQISW